MATLLDDRLVAEYTERRFGYGSLRAPVWFVGMEEGGGGNLDEVRLRLGTWARLGSQPLDDLRDYHLALGFPEVRRHFVEPVKLQRTWTSLIRVLAGLWQQPLTNDQLRWYQAHRLGRYDGTACLLELLPLPSPGVAVWQYGAWSELPQLGNRQGYTAHFAPRRSRALRELVAHHRPALVCFYGLTHRAWWQEVAKANLDEVALSPARRGYVGARDGTACMLVEHPVAHGIPSEYFVGAGEAVRPLIASDGASARDERGTPGGVEGY